MGIAAQTLDDLHSLAQASSQFAHSGVGVDLQAVLLTDGRHPVAHARRLQPTFLAKGDVLPHRELVDQAEVLVDHGNAQGGRGQRVVNGARLAVDANRPGIRQHEADEHLHQRGLACSVFAQDAVDAAPVQGQVNVIAGDYSPEPLGDADEFDRRHRGVRPPGACQFGRCVGHPPP